MDQKTKRIPKGSKKIFPVQDRVMPITTTNRFSTLARMADCESHENGTENLQSEENLRVPRRKKCIFSNAKISKPDSNTKSFES